MTDANDLTSPAIPAVVINLDRHADRLAWFMGNAYRVGLPIERIRAVDAKDPGNAAILEHLHTPGAGLGPSELGCIASHRLAWQRLLDSEHPFIAIFEDDTYLSEDIPQVLRRDLIPEGIDLVKLEVPTGKVSFTRKAHAVHSGRSLHRLLTRAYGAGAYVVSRRCAARLLALTEQCAQPVDVILFDDTAEIWAEFPILQVIPAPSIQDVTLARMNQAPELFDSAIEGDRQAAKGTRKNSDKRRKDSLPMKKLRRYLWCVWHGADPVSYRVYVPLDLGRRA